MLLLRDLSGNDSAGGETTVRRLPFRVGRGTRNDLRTGAPGVWENHFALDWGPRRSVFLKAEPGADTLVNGHRVESAQLRLGDVIQAGAIKLVLGLSPPSQYGLRLRESLTWVGLALIAAAQLFVAACLNP